MWDFKFSSFVRIRLLAFHVSGGLYRWAHFKITNDLAREGA